MKKIMIGTLLMLAIVVLGCLIITTQSPIAAILAVIGIFVLTSAMIALEGGLSILSMTFLIIYVGAIAILFLFIVLLLNLRKTEEPKEKLQSWWSLSVTTALTLSSVFLMTHSWLTGPQTYQTVHTGVDTGKEQIIDTGVIIEKASQLEVLTAMYNSTSFWLIGIILLVAMLGVILLSKGDKVRKSTETKSH
jgi:NADH-ubiquinone oxidoreductase chain 6